MKLYTFGEVRKLLETNQAWVQRAVVVVFERQTQEEKAQEVSCRENGIGFNKPDARQGSKMARWILSGKNLTGWHLKKAFEMMPKYWKQIATEINQKGEARVVSKQKQHQLF